MAGVAVPQERELPAFGHDHARQGHGFRLRPELRDRTAHALQPDARVAERHLVVRDLEDRQSAPEPLDRGPEQRFLALELVEHRAPGHVGGTRDPFHGGGLVADRQEGANGGVENGRPCRADGTERSQSNYPRCEVHCTVQ